MSASRSVKFFNDKAAFVSQYVKTFCDWYNVMAALKQVILVGHCGADRFMLEEAVGRALGPDVVIDSANTSDQLQRHAMSDSLMLVNRLLDGRFDAGDGIELIGHLSQQADPPTAMLISNYLDAQEQAVAAGAVRGFGKSDLDDPATVALLRQAVSGNASLPSP